MDVRACACAQQGKECHLHNNHNKDQSETDVVTDVNMYKSHCQGTNGNRIYIGRERLDSSAAVSARTGSTKLHTTGHAERNDYVKRKVKKKIHDQGSSAPLTNVSIRDIYKFNPTREVRVSLKYTVGSLSRGTQARSPIMAHGLTLRSFASTSQHALACGTHLVPVHMFARGQKTTEKSSAALKVPRTVALMPSGADRGPEVTNSVDRPTTRLLDSPLFIQSGR